MPLSIPIPDITNPNSTGFADEVVAALKAVQSKALSSADTASFRVPIASDREAIAGTSRVKAVPPASVVAAIRAHAPRPAAASTSRAGVVELASRAEVAAGVNKRAALTTLELATWALQGWEDSRRWRRDEGGIYDYNVPPFVNQLSVELKAGQPPLVGAEPGKTSSFGTLLTQVGLLNGLAARNQAAIKRTVSVTPGSTIRVTVGGPGIYRRWVSTGNWSSQGSHQTTTDAGYVLVQWKGLIG